MSTGRYEGCTFVNSLCPDDLCVLPFGHPFATRHRHITGTIRGSADTSSEEQLEILRNSSDCRWDPENHYLAPEGTDPVELIRRGWAMQRRLR